MISGSNEQLQQRLEYTLLKPVCHSRWISKMQSGREDTLEERYAIKFCFKLEKNATETTYGMLQTAFEPSCINRASVFEWHKRFKEGRESARDDERCGRSKGVRTPELIDQIKNFIDKDRCVSIETISTQFDVSVWTVHTIIREELKMRKFCAKFVTRVLKEDQKERHCHDSWSIQVPEFLMLWWPAMKAGSTAMTQRLRDRVASRSMLHAQTQEGQTVQIHPQTLDDPFFWQHWHDLHALGSHWTDDNQQGILCWGFKGVQEEHSSNRVSGIFTRTMHQSTTPFLSQTIWARWASRQFLTFPIVQILLPVTFGYSLSSRKNLERLSLWDNWGHERGCDEDHWQPHTRGLSWGLPEVVGVVQQVHCSRRRLLGRGLEFHVCTINKSAHTKKVCKLIVCSLYIHIQTETHTDTHRGTNIHTQEKITAGGI